MTYLGTVYGTMAALKGMRPRDRGTIVGDPERERPDNLFDPLPRDLGAHGRFGAEAIDRSLQLWATRHRLLLAALGGAALLGIRRR